MAAADSPPSSSSIEQPQSHRGGLQTWLVTGGSGFIGSTFVKLVLKERPQISIVNLDALTYAGNMSNLQTIEDDPRYRFVHGDICDRATVDRSIRPGIDAIVNFAAETHVDRSIIAPEAFLRTDVLGTHVLLEAVRDHAIARFVQVSTDEVYGEVLEGCSTEDDPIAPRSPYAASKAAADLQVLAYHTTFGIAASITRGSNTYGPHQFPEKIVPLFITNLIDDRPVPIYGDGRQIRDWLHVEDHARGILAVLEHGRNGHAYNLGGGNPLTNVALSKRLIEGCGRSFDTHARYVTDRPGHDRRYAVDSSKANAIGWRPVREFEDGLRTTIAWYHANENWWRPLKNGDFTNYYERQYGPRGMTSSH